MSPVRRIARRQRESLDGRRPRARGDLNVLICVQGGIFRLLFANYASVQIVLVDSPGGIACFRVLGWVLFEASSICVAGFVSDDR
jgi:hypothetical protein